MALKRASATSFGSNLTLSPIPFKNPVITCDKIVPEFPLAPINTASSTTSTSCGIFILSSVFSSKSFIIEFNVIDILLPVSPSGTG